MPIVTVTKKEKVGRVIKLTPITFEVPERIVCSEDGAIMDYDSYHMGYECSKCNNFISGVDFVKNELQQQKEKELLNM